MNSSINLDAIAEVKVLLNTYKAEFGHSGRREHRDRQQERQQRLSRQRLLVRPPRRVERDPWENNRAGSPKPKLQDRHAGVQPRRPGQDSRALRPAQATRSCSSSTRWRRRRCRSPGQVRLYRMPTALERAGDFSQTFDANGRLMFIKDPLSSGACNVTTGGAGCFPGNIIPANRLDPNGLALLNCCRCRTSRYRRRLGRAVELHAAGDAGEPAHEQPAAHRRAALGQQQLLGVVPRSSARTSSDPRSPRARRSGGSSTAPTCPATAASTAAGTTCHRPTR